MNLCLLLKEDDFFSSPVGNVLKVSYCDGPLSVVHNVHDVFTGMIPGWFLTKVVQSVLVSCLSRSRGQKIGFQNAIFKGLLVLNYKAHSFHILCITPSRGPLPKLFKLRNC